MALGLGWKLKGDGRTLGPDEVVAPDERLSWGKTVGPGRPARRRDVRRDVRLPADHGPQPAAGDHDERHRDDRASCSSSQGKVPSYLGTSARRSSAVSPRSGRKAATPPTSPARSWSPAWCSLLVGVLIHFLGSAVLHKVLPPVVTGAVVMLIGFNLAPVVAGIYWPQDQWVALATMTFTIVARRRRFRGFIGRIAIFLALIFGTALSWLLDTTRRPDHLRARRRRPRPPTHLRWDNSTASAARRGSASRRRPSSPPTARRSSAGTPRASPSPRSCSCCPPSSRSIAENTGHVKAVAEMTGHDLDPVMGRAHRRRRRRHRARHLGRRLARPRPTPRTSASWRPPGSTPPPPTTWPRSSRSCFGLSPKFGALVASIPGGVLGGITVVLYGMIGLLGAKIWKENGVDFGNPINLVPDRRRHHHRHRQRQAGVHRRLLARGHRPRHHRRRSPATTWPARSPRHELRDRADGARASPWATTSTATATASTTSTRRATPAPPASATPTATAGPDATDRPPRPGRDLRAGRCLSPDPRTGRIAQVKPAPFVHHAPRTVDEARRGAGRGRPRRQGARRRAEPDPDAQHAPRRPGHLVDINRRRRAGRRRGHRRVGAGRRPRPARRGSSATTGRAPRLPLLRQACATSPTRRSATAGTTVGSIAHADPAGEMPACSR